MNEYVKPKMDGNEDELTSNLTMKDKDELKKHYCLVK